MTTTTDEYWSVIPADGVEYPLANLAYNIESWGGTRQGVAPIRGEDTTVPWRPGKRSNPRVADSRTIVLAMWVRGTLTTGEVPIGSTMRREFTTNWNTLKRVLYNRRKPFTLRKRFYDEARTLRIADAVVRFADGLQPEMLGSTGAKFTVDLELSDPFFYGTSTDIALATGGVAFNATILGDDDCRKVTLVMTTGATPPSDFTLVNLTNGHTFSLPVSALVAGQVATIDCNNQNARIDGVNYAGLISHSGSDDWFRLDPGLNTLYASCNSGSWTGTLSYLPTWN